MSIFLSPCIGYVRDTFNIFDAILVAFSITDLILQGSGAFTAGKSARGVKAAKAVKITKLARIVKIFRLFRGIYSCYTKHSSNDTSSVIFICTPLVLRSFVSQCFHTCLNSFILSFSTTPNSATIAA